MEKVYEAMTGISVLPTHVPIPNMGLLPVNAYVIKSREPVLIDTGTSNESEEFMKSLEAVIDLKDLKWIWLTHDDADHTGSIQKVLQAAPKARLVANALTVLRLNIVWPVPMDRVYWINPGGSIDVGDRRFIAVRPSLYDNPASIGVFDEKSEVYFSVDCFGGIMPSKAQNVNEIPKEALEQGMLVWAGADSPWIHMIEQNQFIRELDKVRKMAPKAILSSHLPSSHGMTELFLELLTKVPSSTPFVAPDQTALEQILLQMRAGN
jgi:flavorubredoxin